MVECWRWYKYRSRKVGWRPLKRLLSVFDVTSSFNFDFFPIFMFEYVHLRLKQTKTSFKEYRMHRSYKYSSNNWSVFDMRYRRLWYKRYQCLWWKRYHRLWYKRYQRLWWRLFCLIGSQWLADWLWKASLRFSNFSTFYSMKNLAGT